MIVDSIGLGKLSGRGAAEAKAQAGHDLVLLLTPASTFQDSVINHREICEESARRRGQSLDVALKSCYDPRTGKHNGLCTAILPALITCRSDLCKEIDSTPDSWDDVRRGGRTIRLLHQQPVGLSLASDHSSEHSLRAIMYSFGSSMQDGGGKPNLLSRQSSRRANSPRRCSKTRCPWMY